MANKNSSYSTKKDKTHKVKNFFAACWSNVVKFFTAKKLWVSTTSAVLLVIMMFSVTAGLIASFNKYLPYLKSLANSSDAYDTQYKSTTQVGYSAQILGNVKRNIPTETKNEYQHFFTEQGLSISKYPTYGSTLKEVITTNDENKEQREALRQALVLESSYLCPFGTRGANRGGEVTKDKFNKIDENGNLWYYDSATGTTRESLNFDDTQRKLYKHSASVGMYLGNVADTEPGVIKKVTIRPRGYGRYYDVTGIYAPAGEVIKITISEADMNATGGINIYIGQALNNGQANNIWVGKNQMNRMPHILSTLVLNKGTTTYDPVNKVYVGYVGSFLGGPLYISSESVTFSATISGGVTYPHFILGYTGENEFKESLKSSAPYFDLEVWHYGVLHSGPRRYMQNFSYNDLYKAANLWEKVSSVSTTGDSESIVFIYDPFVAAGAAVAFPGRSSVNCPLGWMTASLNYNAIVRSGSWGNFHEYHHNFQGYGVGGGGEVTNNAMTLVSYALFTKISSSRKIGSYGAAGLGGWNSYTSATWALDQTLRINDGRGGVSNGTKGLALYATLLHNFGADNFIQSKVNQSGGENYISYLKAWQNVTHNDMSYYFSSILGGIDEATANTYRNEDYSMFVPVSSVYQTGRSYLYYNETTKTKEKRYITTMQPYVINFGESLTVDLNKYTVNDAGQYVSGSIVMPQGFSYKIKNITSPQNGKLVKTGDNVYTYTPVEDNNKLRSGNIIVTLEITKDDGAFKVDDVDLVLEFEQTHETKKTMLQRTTYTYAQGSCYTDAVTAFENNYAGYINKPQTVDNVNKTQNCNTDIWYTNKDGDNVPLNSVVELKGKIYIDESAKYRIALRGRWNVALFLSFDGGKTYKDKDGKWQCLTMVQTNTSDYKFDSNVNVASAKGSSFKDYELSAGSWVYFKAVMVTGQQGGKASFIGVGFGKFIPAQGIIGGSEDEDTTPDDYTELVSESVNVSYASAYRQTYEFPKIFESDYLYTKNYNYTYSNTYNDQSQMSIVSNSGCAAAYPIENLIDGKNDTFCMSNAIVSASKPWEFTVDLGKTVTANRFVLVGRLNNNAANQNQTPNSITLYVGTSLDNLKEVTNLNKGSVSGTTLQFNFAASTFRYYKLVVKGTVQGRYASIKNITFSYSLTGNHYSIDNNMFTLSGRWTGVHAQSTYGHIYVGINNSAMSFKFKGTGFAILSSSHYQTNYRVFVDGKEITSQEVINSQSDIKLSFLNSTLADGEHTVVIRCCGIANIDSVVLFK